jgi:hypothetical protein
MKRAVASVAMALALAGCGIEASGLVSANGDASVVIARMDAGSGVDARTEDGKKSPGPGDGKAVDAHEAAKGDGGHDANIADVTPPRDVAEEPSPPAPCSIPPGACVSALPAGWSLVVYATSQATPCPSGFTTDQVVSSPEPQTGACGCTCNVETAPTCDEGSVGRMVSINNGPCNQTGQGVTVAGPGCTPFQTGSGGLAPKSQSSPLPLTAGTCSGSPASDLSAVTTQPGLVCTPPTQCEEQLCEGTAAAGFTLCVSQPGAGGACPAGWQSPVVVGDGVDLSCSACTCDINSQSSCSNAAIDFYTDTDCNTLDTTVLLTGTCTAEPGAGDMPVALKYRATLTQVCAATGPETPTVALSNPQTICCQFE